MKHKRLSGLGLLGLVFYAVVINIVVYRLTSLMFPRTEHLGLIISGIVSRVLIGLVLFMLAVDLYIAFRRGLVLVSHTVRAGRLKLENNVMRRKLGFPK